MSSPALRPSRRRFLRDLGLVVSGLAHTARGAWALPGAANEFLLDPKQHLIPAPADSALWPEFREQLRVWRERARGGYSDALYRRPEFAWVQRAYCCCFLMLCDEEFYDPMLSRWRVRDFLAAGQREFGGYDAVVLWHAYPRIGLDVRNQFDFYRDMPGGLRGLREVSRELREGGARVFVNYNPWDSGTRREEQDDISALAALVGAIEADGIFLDTLDQGAADFRIRLDTVRPGVALESEIALPLARVHDHHLSWAQWFLDSAAPGVLRNKFFERRHMQHQIKRWDHDHSGELQTAWMNGSGMMVWENVFGSWMGWSERDKSMLRSMLPIQRKFSALFAGENWTPLVPTLVPELYASLWEAGAVRLWTLVNRSQEDVARDLLSVELRPGERVFDLVRGTEQELKPGIFRVWGEVPARSVGCILAAPATEVGKGCLADFAEFLLRQQTVAARASSDTTPAGRITFKKGHPETLGTRPNGDMLGIPGFRGTLKIEMRDRECGHYESVPPEGHQLAASYQFRVSVFERRVALPPFRMDRTPVTNWLFREFLRESGYEPRHRENFLKHWQGREFPAELAEHPVVYVDLEDARAYARHSGKRLPMEEEWQFAAAGSGDLLYPWGNEMLPGRCNGGELGTTTPVGAYPEGQSPFGVYDLCGNVWELTESERTDGRTRFCILRGGCWYTARGSGWYMDGGPRPNNFAAKMLLMWPGVDRCGTVGFRCVAPE